MIKFSKSNSAELQESFVLTITQEKRNGYYLELGVEEPYKKSNTSLLESEYGWIGLPIDINKEFVDKYNLSERKNKCVYGDAMRFDYKTYFEENNFPKQIDYLQIDIDNHIDANPLLALIQLPLMEYRFSVITYEHSCMHNFKNVISRDAQREILSSLGYVLLIGSNYEDWWIDPKVIDKEIYEKEYVINMFPHLEEVR